ncbi:MAG: AraC family transcriptional regulator ligand-binding domain-containing protein [Proteobacteria bacterium]|nr:AraC family transcriptional regulator ligand-binding domain-containing protein [Pseudomonadota bacterium]
MDQATVSAGYPKGFLDFAVSRGADRAALLARASLKESDLAEPDARVALPRYVALIKAGIALLDDPALALKFGENVRMQDISIVGLICEAAETTAEVGRQLNRYSRLMVDGADTSPPDIIRTVRDAEGPWMEITSGFYNGNPLLIEAEFARIVWNARVMFAGNLEFEAMQFPRAVRFAHAEPSYRAEYERVFRAPVVFSSGRNALLLDERFGTLRQPPTNRYVFGVLSKRAEALLKELESAKSTRARVERLLLPILHTGDAGIAPIAQKMGLSTRTLQRRLAQEGVSFATVLDELRHRIALHYLSGRKVSANETAYLVGFSDPAAFARAFKRWTGTSPGAIREARSEEI